MPEATQALEPCGFTQAMPQPLQFVSVVVSVSQPSLGMPLARNT